MNLGRDLPDRTYEGEIVQGRGLGKSLDSLAAELIQVKRDGEGVEEVNMWLTAELREQRARNDDLERLVVSSRAQIKALNETARRDAACLQDSSQAPSCEQLGGRLRLEEEEVRRLKDELETVSAGLRQQVLRLVPSSDERILLC